MVIGDLADGRLADGAGIQHDTLSRWRSWVRIPSGSPLPTKSGRKISPFFSFRLSPQLCFCVSTKYIVIACHVYRIKCSLVVNFRWR